MAGGTFLTWGPGVHVLLVLHARPLKAVLGVHDRSVGERFMRCTTRSYIEPQILQHRMPATPLV